MCFNASAVLHICQISSEGMFGGEGQEERPWSDEGGLLSVGSLLVVAAAGAAHSSANRVQKRGRVGSVESFSGSFKS